jgi:peptidyl-prolyl cis-trans isomerase B (cyclophilin B)
MRTLILSVLLCISATSLFATENKMSEPSSKIKLTTSLGSIIVQLNTEKAPVSSANFLKYVSESFYNGTIFHRIIKGFMAQGGGFDASFKQKETHAPIKNEADNGLKNTRGTLAMARTNDPNSATAQFFINYKDNSFLDHTSPTPSGWGYAVFGEVIEGMDVVDKMADQPTGTKGGHKAKGARQKIQKPLTLCLFFYENRNPVYFRSAHCLG